MKLKNKISGEIKEFVIFDGNEMQAGLTLKDLAQEWEDYAKPKKYWYMDYGGRVKPMNDSNDEEDIARREIGNYFETKEEAERAVEKLKTWKRLKDKGFRFDGIREDYTRYTNKPFRDGKRYLHFNKSEDEEWMKENWQDLTMLFGGDE